MGSITVSFIIVVVMLIVSVVCAVTGYVLGYEQGRRDFIDELNERVAENIEMRIEDIYLDDCQWK